MTQVAPADKAGTARAHDVEMAPNATTARSENQMFRVGDGLIDRDRQLSFSFNGRQLDGYLGDTLASALLANGVRLVGRSFKYHRPRGIFSAGAEEPNALVELGEGARQDPNTRATTAELFDGLTARSQNHIGPLSFDIMAANDWLAPFLSAGFYYKTFMWPAAFWERFYEPSIRRAAGLGRLSGKPDPDTYGKGYLHCDLLVIGGGPAGLSAALAAGRSGAQVILADDDFRFGGRLLSERGEIEGVASNAWATQAISELAAMPNVRLMSRTNVFGVYDHGIYGALERCTDHQSASGSGPRQILWRLYAKRALLCAGATERSIAFPNNDRPGVMLSGAVRSYLNRFGVTAGHRIAIFTNNDDGWRTAHDLAAAGIDVLAIVDTRDGSALTPPAGVRAIHNAQIVDTSGRLALRSITLSNGERMEVDCLAVSGGWNPAVHLTSHHRSLPRWREDIAAFVPSDRPSAGLSVAGGANGSTGTGAVLREGHARAVEIMHDLGHDVPHYDAPHADDEPSSITAFWHVTEGKGRCWVDLQNDVTTKDVKQAATEGFHSVEHLKRYTTLGMATDQGKTSNVLGLAILAEARGDTIADTGTTVFRPPANPVAISAFGGGATGRHFRPTRLTPSHDWTKANGAVFVEAGAWLRAQYFPIADETHWRESVDREVRQTRASVGVCDVTTLGKIDIQGPDAGEFINRVYANGFAKLAVGRVRYGLMLREDGHVMDDGTTARLAMHHYVMTTTTANAVSVFRHLEFCRQCLWPALDVHLVSVTEQWAQFSVAGPNARNLLSKIIDPEFDISNESFPFMACANISVCGGVSSRLFRISFSGELAYEIAVPARYGNSMMAALMAAGAEYTATAYGTEALGVMRVEKGHAAGNELNGQTTARNLGLERMLSKSKDFIGRTLSEREGLNRSADLSLVGFQPIDKVAVFKAGAHFIAQDAEPTLTNDQGWMTSVAYSPTLESMVGLGFIKSGAERMGEVVRAYDPVRGGDTPVKIVSPHFFDAAGERLRG